MAAEQDVEVEDDLARGMSLLKMSTRLLGLMRPLPHSPETSTGVESSYICSVQEELCS